MNWFKGGIAEAVAQTKKTNAIFVVFVSGNDDLSTKLGGLIDSDIIRKYLESSSFVSIRIDSGSEAYTQFAQIYQVVPLPSLFFIGQNGTPVEVVTGLTTTVEDLEQKIRGVMERVGIPSASPVSSGPEAAGPSESPKEDTVKEQATPSDMSAEEKLARAKELIEKKRKEKEAEEAQREKEKELQRRRQGQDVASLKKWQEDQELKQLKEDRLKEKKEAQEARKKILEQIEQDKRERAQRFAPATSASAPAAAPAEEQQQIIPPVSNSDSSRIQFKTPSGDTVVHTFASSDQFLTVREYVRWEILGNSGVTDFTLATTFPRREFTVENDNETLSELRLTPSAVLLIIPRGRGGMSGSMRSSQVASTPTGGTIFHFVTSLLWSFLSPVMSVLSYMRNWAFPRPDPGQQKRAAEEQIPDHDAAKRRNLNIPTTSSSSHSNDNAQPSSSKSAEAAYRRLGSSNIHRLHDRKDSDDENNTWNGNSTQQM